MNSFRILDTYRAYKARERKFTNWLRETAGKLGYEAKPRPKGSKAGSDMIKISEIPQLVTKIVEAGEKIPENLRQLLGDVISQRKEASAFYRPRGKADEGHAHYLSVLRDALKTFEKSSTGRFEESVKKAATSSPSSDTALNNVFDLLRVDANKNGADGSSGEDSEKESEKKTGASKKGQGKMRFGKKKGKARKAPKAEQRVEPSTDLERFDAILDQKNEIEDDDDDLYFMIYCFFIDFNHMREYLQERWCDYQDGILSLSTVSVITNTTFELLQRSEEELLRRIPVRSGLRSYEEMALMLFTEVGLAHVDYDGKTAAYEDDPDGMDNAIAEEADFVCLPRFWDLSGWLANVPPRKVTVLPHFVHKKINYQCSYISEMRERDTQIIHELVGECTLLKALSNHPGFQIPGQDEFTNGIIQMLATRHIPIWLVLAAQVQCDIRYILEDNVGTCHSQVLAMGTRVEKILHNYVEFSQNFDIRPSSLIKTTYDEVDCWIAKDFAEPKRTELHVEHGQSKAEIEKYYYLRRNPTLCGLMIFRFALTMNELGLKNSNQWGTTIAAAHLYNALIHQIPDFPKWHDMDALIQIHSFERIFWRPLPPDHPHQFSGSYERASGVSSMISQRQGATAGIISPKHVEARGIAPVSVVSSQWWDRFCFLRKERIHNLPDVEKVLNSKASDQISHVLKGLRSIMEEAPGEDNSLSDPFILYQEPNQNLESQFQSTHTLTNTQLLTAICTRLHQESYTLNFDYFTFHTRCMHVLQAVYDEFKEEIVNADGELEMGRAELPCVPHWIFMWMQDEKKSTGVVERLGRVVRKFVRETGGKEVVALREFLSGKGARSL